LAVTLQCRCGVFPIAKLPLRNCLINRFGTFGHPPLAARKAPKRRFRPRSGLPREATVAPSRNYQTVSRRSAQDPTRLPLVDSSRERRDKANRHILRSCHRRSQARREHRLRGAQGAGAHLSQRSGRDTPHSARVELDLGDSYLTLLGFFRGEEFMEADAKGRYGASLLGTRLRGAGHRAAQGEAFVHLRHAPEGPLRVPERESADSLTPKSGQLSLAATRHTA
jgi:hypothetical protein